MKLILFTLVLSLFLMQGCAMNSIDPETKAFFYDGWRNPKVLDDPDRQYLTTQ